MNDEGAIKELLEKQYPAFLNAEDIDGYVAMYSEDVIWAVPNMPDATSPEQIGVLLEKLFGKVAQTVEVTVDDLMIEGDRAIAMAVATGTAARKPDGVPQPLAIRVIWVLRRQAETWKITRQVGTPKPSA